MQRKRVQERGIALVVVLLFSSIILIVMATASKIAIESQSAINTNFTQSGQAVNIARAGLEDTQAWFKRKAGTVKWDTTDAAQGCADQAFYPRENTADLELGDTLDEDIGLVKDLQINGNLWGRYIIKRQQNCSNLSKNAVRDITFNRGLNNGSLQGQGIVWYVESEGIVYLRNNPTKTPQESPNRILSRAKSSFELQRVLLQPPKSPLTLNGTTASTFNSNCKIIGDAASQYGIVRNNNTPNYSGTPEITVPTTATPNFQLSASQGAYTVETVFGMDSQALKNFSDSVYTNVNDMPDKAIPMSVIYLDGNFTFTATDRLAGSGVLFVNGNLTLNADANAFFSGLTYVTGTLSIGNSNSLAGSIVAGRVVCTPSNSSVLEYSDSMMNSMRARLGGYRKNNLSFVVKK